MFSKTIKTSSQKHCRSSTQEDDIQALVVHYQTTRKRSLEICNSLEIEDYVVQTASYTSPIRWHLGHGTWLFEMLLAKCQKNYQPVSDYFLYYFNSYYHNFGERIDKNLRGTKSRPTVAETLRYREEVDARVISFLNRLDKKTLLQKSFAEIHSLFVLGLEHEQQHQELMLYDIKHLLADLYKPIGQQKLASTKAEPSFQFVDFSGGLFEIGASKEAERFAYDNEKQRHRVYLEPFQIANKLTTNADYLEFMEDGGYSNYKFWLSEGWERCRKENWEAPLYWERQGDYWFVRDFRGFRKFDETEPVSHISFFEASAYARWRGARLPTEAEWEVTCAYGNSQESCAFPWGEDCFDNERANFFESYLWHPTQAGTFLKGKTKDDIYQMLGDLWEWTSSDYCAYPGFSSGFDEYNDKWFVGQKVLRGGSWASNGGHIRSTYRNFYYPHERWLTSGIRLAKTF